VFNDDLKPGGREQSDRWQSSTQVSSNPRLVIMSTKLFVGNLSYNVTENDLQDLFSQYGTVNEVNLMLDRMSGRSRGFAFVTLDSKESADAAAQALNGKNWEGRNLSVNEARPREERPERSGRFGGGGGGGEGRGGGGGGGGYRSRR
jgi:RNA recognition motif-containing protein